MLVYPLWLGALALLFFNDHLFKGSGFLPGVVTGKLSDIAGLVVAPALLATLLRLRGRASWLACHLAIGLVFAGIKLSPSAAAGFEALMALGPFPWRITVDPTDLLALPALFVSWRLGLVAMTRPVDLARPVAQVAWGAGLLTSMATSPPPDGPFPSIQADLVLGAASNDALILRIRPLRDSVHLDCAVVARSPSTTLARELFGPAEAWRVEPGRVVQVQGDGVNAPTGECFAALVDGTLHRAASGSAPRLDDNLPVPPALLFWTARDFPPELMGSSQNEVPRDRLVVVSATSAGAVWQPHSALFSAPPAIDATPIPGCEPAPQGGFIDWETPVPVGSRTLESIASAPDGCHRLIFASEPAAAAWYVCTGTPTIPFVAGDTVHLSLVTVGQRFRRVDGVMLLGDGAAMGKRLVLARGGDLATWGDGDWTARDLPECRGSHGACGNLVVPQALSIDAPAGVTRIVAGDQIALGGTLVLHRAERVPVGDDLCLPEAVASDGLVFESVYFEPRIPE